ncbi:UNVERIFIED_CONTAM: Gypsy retrotransposon integrase-like protein 1 [Sesamum indicum]
MKKAMVTDPVLALPDMSKPFVVETDASDFANHALDGLSRMVDLANLESVATLSSSAVATSIRDRARELLQRDPAAQGLIQLVEQGKARQFWVEDGLLMSKANRLFVPKGGDLRKSLISKCHDTLWAGHQGKERTYALVQRTYYWPQMRDDVDTYIRTCLICQHDKANNQKKAGLLQPLRIPKRPWESVSMDYICGLPKKDWMKLLDVAQLCFNAQKSSSTNKSTFEIVTGQQLLLPHTLDTPQSVRYLLARCFSQEWKQNVPDPRLTKLSRGRDPRLMQKYVCPLFTIKRIGTVGLHDRVASWWKIHNVFLVIQLKKYSAEKEDDARNQPSRPQLQLTKTKEKVAEAILNHRVTSIAKQDHTEYLVKWSGCSSEENT